MNRWLAALALLALAACSDDDERKQRTCSPFELETGCAADELCVPSEQDDSTGTCQQIPTCEQDSDCGPGMICERLLLIGLCVEEGSEGVECETDAECKSPLQCLPISHAGMLKACLDPTPPRDGSCDYDFHCAADEFCGFESSRCITGTGIHCRNDEDCWDGERCHPVEEACYRR